MCCVSLLVCVISNGSTSKKTTSCIRPLDLIKLTSCCLKQTTRSLWLYHKTCADAVKRAGRVLGCMCVCVRVCVGGGGGGAEWGVGKK